MNRQSNSLSCSNDKENERICVFQRNSTPYVLLLTDGQFLVTDAKWGKLRKLICDISLLFVQSHITCFPFCVCVGVMNFRFAQQANKMALYKANILVLLSNYICITISTIRGATITQYYQCLVCSICFPFRKLLLTSNSAIYVK